MLPAAIAAFLALCPLVVMVTGILVRADNAATERAESSWHQVDAVLLQAAAAPAQLGDVRVSLAPARWTLGGRQLTGVVAAPNGAPAGSHVMALLDRAGNVELSRLTTAEASQRIVDATLLGFAVLAALLTVALLLARRCLDRFRLASWETAWLAVGPAWSRPG